MSDRDLHRLKDLPIPEASAERKAEALQSAMAAFDANEKVFSNKTKGSDNPSRLKAVSTTSLWEWIMQKRYYVGPVAASLLIAPLAVHLTVQQMDENDDRPILEGLFSSPTPAEETEALVELTPANKPEKSSPVALSDRSLGRTDRTEAPNIVGFAPSVSEAEPSDLQGIVAAPPAPSTDSHIVRQGGGSIDGVTAQAPRSNEVSSLYGRVAPAPAAERKAKRERAIALNSKALSSARHQPRPQDALPAQSAGDRFSQLDRNGFLAVDTDPVSTFSIDVDTASYSYVRKLLNRGELPSADAVRTEEMVNYFTYDYPLAENLEQPFKPSVTVYPTPWNQNTQLMHVAIRAFDVPEDARPPVNLVFLVDVSGSMQAPDKLPLLKASLRLLLSKLDAEDTISLVTYAGSAGTALEPTSAAERSKILSALDNLAAGGSTAGAAGIRAAYDLAHQSKKDGSINRVILATDGDFNVGVSSDDELKKLISEKRNEGVFLSVLGFGTGNYNDSLMQVLAQNGNGTAAYIDTLGEARKVMVEQAGSALVPVAKDVKIQVEFNPATVSEYRLIGYETRALNRADFNNDKVDAGDVNAGHRVTALYEFTPAGTESAYNDALRYKKETTDTGSSAEPSAQSNELAFLKLRYKLPDSDKSKLITLPILKSDSKQTLDAVSNEVAFATGVAAFAEKLSGSEYSADYSYDEIKSLAKRGLSGGNGSLRNEFVGLVDLAELLSAQK
ncbi:MAG: von Willebrand factor type A domain-containing protein [Stappiaceae bacterium]